MERNSAVIYDASVLFSASLRDLLIQIGVYSVRAELFRPKWTEQINDEWIRNVKKEYPNVNMVALECTRTLMNKAVRECLVSGYHALIEDVDLTDPDDRHVVAAAKNCSAKIIVTANLSDFPDGELSKHGLKAMSADDFLMMLIKEHDDGEEILVAAVKTIHERLRAPVMTWEEYFSTLENPQGPKLKRTVACLRQLICF